MELLYTVILLLAGTQFAIIRSLEASDKYNETATPITLYNYYITERNLFARDTCVQLKNVIKKILNNQTVQKAESPLMQEFKNNITEFQELYPIYKQYGLYHEILLKLQLAADPYFFEEEADNSNSQFILGLLRKVGYDKIMDEYEDQIMNFLTINFLSKLEDLKNRTAHNQTEKLQELFSWAEEMEDCEDYDCFDYHMSEINELLITPKQALFDYIKTEMMQLTIFYGSSLYRVLKKVPQNKKLLQLPTDTRQSLLHNIKEFVSIYESEPDFDELDRMVNFVYKNVLLKFHDSQPSKIPLKQRQLIVEIFNDHGLAQFHNSYEKKFKQFLYHDLVNEFEYFKEGLSKADLSKEKKLLDWFKHFKSLTEIEDKNNIFYELDDMMEENQ